MVVDLGYAFTLPPEKAVEYFQSKGHEITWGWQDMWQEAHAKAFTVAGITKLDVLQDIRAGLQQALRSGDTLADFDKQLRPILQRKGWWGRDAQTDKVTGEVFGKGLNPYRLRTIYQTNLQTAYMAGRYAGFMQDVENRPLWEYVAVLDSKTRPSHRALDGRVFRYDDPFWETMYPPNGFNCRCRVRARRADDDVYPSSSDGRMETIQVGTPGKQQSVTGYRDSVSGKLFTPDAGWSYNPGKAAFPNLLEQATLKLERAEPALASAAVSNLLDGKAWQHFAAKPEGIFPMAILSAEDAKRIRAQTQVVGLSADTLQKQARQHPELKLDEYTHVQAAIERGQVVQDTPVSLIYVLEDDGYVAVVKATKSGQAVFMTSFRRLSADQVKRDEEVKRLLKKGK